MVSPGAIDHVKTILCRFEEEASQRAPELLRCSAAERDAGMMEVWEHVLQERGYEVIVQWEHGQWGIETWMEGTRETLRVSIGHKPPVPPWPPVDHLKGEDQVWVEPPQEGHKIDTIVLIREVRPDWSLKEATACAEGKHPLLTNVRRDAFKRARAYLRLAGAIVSVTSALSESAPESPQL